MVNLTINKKRFLKHLDAQETDELYHQMAMLGIEVESHDGDEIVVDITPNRPDLLSQPGVTRAVGAFIGKTPGLKEYSTTKSKLKVKVDPSVEHVRPFTACAVAKNLKLDDEGIRELIDIQEKLHITFCRQRKRAAIGVYPMEAITGNITYLAMDPKRIKFRPLEAKKVMSMPDILKKHPKGKEYAHLLKGLSKYAVFIDSKKNVLSVPPIINSHKTGKVTKKTKAIFIESSGHDMRICDEIVRMMCAALADMGATIQTVDVQYGRKIVRTPDMSTQRQQFYGYYVNRRLGLDLRKEDFPKILAKMGLGFQDGRIRETHYALLPPYRVDFIHQADVVEDVAIGYGYENIVPVLPDMATIASESAMTLLKDKLRQVLTGYGLLEAKNYHLLSATYQQEIRNEEQILLKSCVSEEYNSLRTSLLNCLLHTLKINKIHEYPQQLFELGRIFSADERVHESEQLSVVLAGDVDYTKIRQIVDGILLSLGLTGEFTPTEDERFLEGRCARLKIGKLEIGVLGEISPRVLSTAELLVPVAACELNVESLLSLLT